MREPDLVIVGGGIAGGALATVMARAGASVLMLERQPEYRDHASGEIAEAPTYGTTSARGGI